MDGEGGALEEDGNEGGGGRLKCEHVRVYDVEW